MGVLHRPRTAAEALAHLAAGPALLIAGGTDIFPAFVDKPSPAALIDLSAIADMRGIQTTDEYIRIGAATRWSEIARATLPPAFRMLQQAAREIGSVQIQNRATLGGNLCNASPAADGAPPLLALEAEVELLSSRGIRRIAVADFLVGNRLTQRAPDEIMTAIVVPRTHENARSTFLKLGARKYLVISIVMVAVLLDLDDAHRIRAARIAIGAASATARRLRTLEAHLVGASTAQQIEERIAESDFADLSPIDDVRATAGYRRDVAQKLVTRALIETLEGADA